MSVVHTIDCDTYHFSTFDIGNFDGCFHHSVASHQLGDQLSGRVADLRSDTRQLDVGERALNLVAHHARIVLEVVAIEVDVHCKAKVSLRFT